MREKIKTFGNNKISLHENKLFNHFVKIIEKFVKVDFGKFGIIATCVCVCQLRSGA